ncbi:MAG: phenylacetate--CoA ligase family protein [Rhodospirillales bacterium]
MTDLPVKTSRTDLCWPAVPESTGSTLLAILFQLERSQWWSAERLVERQMAQLGLLLAHAERSVPFYRKRFEGTGATAKGHLSLDEWSRLPLLRRADIQAAGDDLLSTALPQSHGQPSAVFTSGSTGKPIRAVRSQIWGLFWSAFTIRNHLWHGRDMRGKLAAIRESGKGKDPYPDGTAAPNWGLSSSLVFDTGPSVCLNITCSIEQQVDWLVRQDPDYLLTLPSIAQRLAEHCLDNGIRLPKLRQIETISEILRPATRDACLKAWDVPVIDTYTAREAGYIALQCPECEHYHVQAESIFVEVLDEQDRPCAPGEVGRVVVTPLHNFAMPLIRYDIGDFAEVGDPCPCGRGLPVLRRILGRRQDMLVLPSGEDRWPLLSSGDIGSLLAIAPIRQYQFVQKSVELIELRLVAERELTADEEDGLRRWVGDKFGHPFEVAITYHEAIPRTAAGKYQDFINEVGEVRPSAANR